MCGRYSLTLPPEAVRRWFAYRGQPNIPARFNIAPTDQVPIIRLREAAPEMIIARWGLIPTWAKEIGTKPLINARSEGVTERPAYRDAFRERRCLVPADGFYEWQVGEGGAKTPYRICLPDRGVFAMAGIWAPWRNPADGAWLTSFAVMTTMANRTLTPIHERMPVILNDEDREEWMAPETPPARLTALLKAAPEDRLEAYAISSRVNAVANDDAAILEPASATAASAAPVASAGSKGKQLPLL